VLSLASMPSSGRTSKAGRKTRASSPLQDIRTNEPEPQAVRGNDPEQVAEGNLTPRLRKRRKGRANDSLTPKHEAELAAMPGDASQLASDSAASLMEDIRTLGRLPKAVRGNDPKQVAERNLAKRLRYDKKAGRLTPGHEAELAAMDSNASQLADDPASSLMRDPASNLMRDIRSFGRVPKAVRGGDPEQVMERNLASRLSKMKQAGRLTPEHLAELAALQGAGAIRASDQA